MEYKAYSAQTRKDIRNISEQHGGIQVVLQLDRRELTSSASRWKLRHLIAYRLLVYQEEAFLSILEPDHHRRCPVCTDDQSCHQRLNYTRTKALLAENPRELCAKTECELMQLPDGFFWVALARAARPELAVQARVQPQRERKQVEREGYINSQNAIPGSSSPIWHSSSEFETELGDLDEDEHEARRSRPEEVTVHLVTCFLQYALNLCLLQHSADQATEVEARPRVERRKTKAYIAGDVLITAEDDGGICWMRRVGLGWEMSHPFLALLEAKREFKYIHFNESSESYFPVVSNENLAQCLGEAVITKKGNPEFLQDDVFLIAATNTYMRFLHFRFGRDYMKYLDTIDETAQIELINDEEKDTLVYMHSTRWFNLQSQEGRRNALCHVLGLLRWHDTRDIHRQAAGNVTEKGDHYEVTDESGDDSDDGYDDDSMDTEE